MHMERADQIMHTEFPYTGEAMPYLCDEVILYLIVGSGSEISMPKTQKFSNLKIAHLASQVWIKHDLATGVEKT